MMNSEPTIAQAQRVSILQRTFSGARWMLYLSASALALGFCTNVLLGRMGAETLGFYSLLMLIVGVVQTFFVFGGSNVLVNYLPGLSAVQRPRLIFSYALIVFVFGFVLYALCLLFPAVMGLLFGAEVDISINSYLLVLVPLLLAQALVWAILQAELEGVALALSHNAVSWFYFVNVVLLIVLGVLSPSHEPRQYIFGAVVVANIVALLIGVFFLRREYFARHGSDSLWFLPKGLWRFTTTLHIGTLLNFVIGNAAPLFILRELGLRELGYFRAASVFAGFVTWVPGVFDKSFYPSFCNLVRRNLLTHEEYTKFSRLNAFSSGVIALVIVLFTRELLSVFGKEISEGAYFLLTILAVGYAISTPFVMTNFALVTAYERTTQTMIAYGIGAGVAIALYASLVPMMQLHGIALAFILLQLLMLGISIWLVQRYCPVQVPTRAHLLSLAVVAFGGAGAYYFGQVSFGNTVVKTGLCAAFFSAVLAMKIITTKELKEMFSVIVPEGS
jgi:O-antigen/teichoic acid export membrane protein